MSRQDLGLPPVRPIDSALANAFSVTIVRVWLAFGMITVEQRVVRLAAQRRRDLPCQVMNVLHSGVETKTSGWRHLVGCVSGQEDVADAIAIGNDG